MNILQQAKFFIPSLLLAVEILSICVIGWLVYNLKFRKAITVITQDRPKLKELKYKLKRKEKYYRSLFEYSLDGIFALDIEGKFMEINPMIEQISGYTREELLGRLFVDLLPPSYMEIAYADFARVVEGEPLVKNTAILSKGGQRVEVRIMAVPIRVDNEIIGILGMAKDITEEKRMQERLTYLSYRDALTTLYNRLYFEEEMHRVSKEKPSRV